MRESVEKIHTWLDPTFFTLPLGPVPRRVERPGLAVLALVRVHRRARPREGRGAGPPRGPGRLSAFGLIVFAFTVTLASFDWLMSMTPTWYSTVFGVYYFAGAMVAALSVMVLLTLALQTSGALAEEVARSHYYAIGRLMLTFVIFWAYIAYSQGFLIWIGDIPEEIHWYLLRWDQGWVWVLGILAVGHFLLPFFVLLNYAIKHKPRPLSLGGRVAPRPALGGPVLGGGPRSGRLGRDGAVGADPGAGRRARAGLRLRRLDAGRTGGRASRRSGVHPLPGLRREMTDLERRDPTQETDEVAGRKAVAWWVGTILVIAVCTALSFVAIQIAQPGSQEAFPAPKGRVGVGGPRGMYTAATHTEGPDSAVRLRLETYRWVDRANRIVAVPISEAMRLLAADSTVADSTGGGS